MAAIDDLRTAVQANTAAVNSAVFAFQNPITPPAAGVSEADAAAFAATVASDAARLAAAIPATPA